MKKLFAEFKAFITKGDVVSMAVGIIIGAAFKAIVDSLVNDIISPVIGLFADTNFSDLTWSIGGVTIGYGSFLTAVINFLIMALVLFALVKALAKAKELGDKLHPVQPVDQTAPVVRLCPYCKSQIDPAATRCPHCTSQLEAEAPEKP